MRQYAAAQSRQQPEPVPAGAAAPIKKRATGPAAMTAINVKPMEVMKKHRARMAVVRVSALPTPRAENRLPPPPPPLPMPKRPAFRALQQHRPNQGQGDNEVDDQKNRLHGKASLFQFWGGLASIWT